ncbi:hypothetical protein NPIL_499931 [Nephila pilipes]|uniref:Uncharacterized protein n=1 Tax=Nephila pilipes TaxID=299642 RepID=A0A8X6P0N6_NEPPI|nr:hypothetical protein NPIL_499931 [Nephila pilipes]
METSNQFYNLNIEEPPDFLVESEQTLTTAATRVTSTAAKSNKATRNERPIPPITIDHIPRKDLLIKQLRNLTSGSSPAPTGLPEGARIYR